MLGGKRTAYAALWAAALAMEVSCVYAWASFSFDAVVQRRYPLGLSLLPVVLAALAPRLRHARGWQLAQVLSIHILGLTLCLALGLRAPSESLANLLVCVWTVAFWVHGARFAARERSHASTCGRFDRGIGWLFALLLMRLLIHDPASVPLRHDLAETLILPYFSFGLLAIALSRNRTDADRSHIRGRRGFGTLIAFGACVVLFGFGGLSLFLPQLRAASHTGFATFTSLLAPFEDLIAHVILLFVWLWFQLRGTQLQLPRLTRSRVSAPIGKPDLVDQQVAQAADSHVLGAVLSVLLAMCLLLAAYYVWRWLLARTRGVPLGPSLLQRLWAWLVSLKAQTKPESIRLYAALLRWGQRSGVPKRASETPLEYARRLQLQLPAFSDEFDRLVGVYNQHVYARVPSDDRSIAYARRGLRKLHSPRLWPKRARLWLSGGEEV